MAALTQQQQLSDGLIAQINTRVEAIQNSDLGNYQSGWLGTVINPNAGPQSCTVKWDAAHGGKACKAKRSKLKQVTTPAAAAELSSMGSPGLVDVAKFTYDKYYSKPYDEPENSQNDLYVDLPEQSRVHRPNHGLCHALRKALLVPRVAAALGWDDISPHSVFAIQVTLLFQVVGRRSEVGFSTNPNAHNRYSKNSRKALRDYNAKTSLMETNRLVQCLEGLKQIYSYSGSSNRYSQVFKYCHQLELFRCHGKMKMKPRMQGLRGKVGDEQAMKLQKCALNAIRRTGDRLMCGGTGHWDSTKGYSSEFGELSHHADQCMHAILDAHEEVT